MGSCRKTLYAKLPEPRAFAAPPTRCEPKSKSSPSGERSRHVSIANIESQTRLPEAPNRELASWASLCSVSNTTTHPVTVSHSSSWSCSCSVSFAASRGNASNGSTTGNPFGCGHSRTMRTSFGSKSSPRSACAKCGAVQKRLATSMPVIRWNSATSSIRTTTVRCALNDLASSGVASMR